LALPGAVPALLRVPLDDVLPILHELQRLGAPAQAMRWDDDRAWLRVPHLPWHTLLRTHVEAERVRVYLPAGLRVYVAAGWQHPQPDAISPLAGKHWLLDPPDQWHSLPDTGFHALSALHEFPLVGIPQAEPVGLPLPPLRTRLRLIPLRGPTAPATLWVFRAAEQDQLHTLLRLSDDAVVQPLQFALGQVADETVALVWAGERRESLALPVRVVGYRAYQQMPNLFLPVGQVLAPSVRREVLREQCAPDPTRLYWLTPTGTVHSVPRAGFGPLTEAFAYTVAPPVRLPLPVRTPTFPLVSFEVVSDEASKPTKVPNQDVVLPPPAVPKVVVTPGQRPLRPAAPVPDEVELTPSQAQQQLIELIAHFQALPGPADAPERRSLWPQLARAYAALEQTTDAHVCWQNAVWDTPAQINWLNDWRRLGRPKRHADDWGTLLLDTPTQSSLSRLVVELLRFTHSKERRPDLAEWLPELLRYFAAHARLLPARGEWLGWRSLYELAGHDVLGLARARDRLLTRLLEQGLTRDLDLPAFLRQTSSDVSAILSLGVDEFAVLHARMRTWRQPPGYPNAYDPLAELTFAVGFARLGATAHADQVAARALEQLNAGSPVEKWTALAFQFRLHSPNQASWPAEIEVAYQRLKPDERRLVDRIRQASQILEPFERTDPYRHFRQEHELRGDRVGLALARWAELREPADLTHAVAALPLADLNPIDQMRRCRAILSLGARAGETLIVTTLAELPGVQERVPLFADLTNLLPFVETLEQGLILASAYDRLNLLDPIQQAVQRLLQSQKGERVAWMIGRLTGSGLRLLERLGQHDVSIKLQQQMEQLILNGRTLAQLTQAAGVNWAVVLPALLYLAGGWLRRDKADVARGVLDLTRKRLFAMGPMDSADERTDLACHYVRALGHGPAALANERLTELFVQLAGDFQSPAVRPLRLVDTIVRTIASVDFSLDPEVRRWLAEDEFAVRRRIHRDLQTATSVLSEKRFSGIAPSLIPR
jgi:hypothetical protein